ncbi:YgaP family membrane protein [Salinilacihabitans rarus]|uniref:YgaP family membrane protein n=1 Tax=Salinilacihabitans rarus TaxID=2961596 RepID=UPI0020C8D1B6|nr:DUF2892 domain-containing protein [Salinilacihabitans rarus]
MKKNVGGFDRTWRLVVGPVLIVVGVAALAGVVAIGTVPAAVALVAGAVVLATGLLRTCVLSRLLGIDTYRGAADESSDPVDEVSARRPS